MVENVPVSVTDRDIPTSNGVVHVLDGPLMLAPRMDEAIAADPQLSVINKWFDRFSGYTTVGIENDKVDTTLIKFYNVTEKTGSGQSLNIADEDFFNTAFLPTDEAMRTFLSLILLRTCWCLLILCRMNWLFLSLRLLCRQIRPMSGG